MTTKHAFVWIAIAVIAGTVWFLLPRTKTLTPDNGMAAVASGPPSYIKTGVFISSVPDNHVTLENGLIVNLEVKNESQGIVVDGQQFCGYGVGDVVYATATTTDYALVVNQDGKETSRYEIYKAFGYTPNENNGGLFFISPAPGNERAPHTGIRTITDTVSGQEFLMIYQYATCNTETAAFFVVDGKGIIHHILFKGSEGSVPSFFGVNDAGVSYSVSMLGTNGGTESPWITTDYLGTIDATPKGLRACFRNNGSTKDICTLYTYEPKSYVLHAERLP